MDNVNLFDILKNEGEIKTILVYPFKETPATNYDSADATLYNPIPVKGLVFSVSYSSLKWKYFGTLPIGSKKILIEKRNKSLFLNAHKIKIGTEEYKCYKDDSQSFRMKEIGDYLEIILERKA